MFSIQIDHMDGWRDFTFSPTNFPLPEMKVRRHGGRQGRTATISLLCPCVYPTLCMELPYIELNGCPTCVCACVQRFVADLHRKNQRWVPIVDPGKPQTS